MQTPDSGETEKDTRGGTQIQSTNKESKQTKKLKRAENSRTNTRNHNQRTDQERAKEVNQSELTSCLFYQPFNLRRHH